MKGGKVQVFIPKEDLHELYLDKNLPLTKIAQKYNCSINTVDLKLRKFGIEIRSASQANKLSNKYKVDISKSDLEELVLNKRLGMNEIAKRYNCSSSTIRNKISQYKIGKKISNWKKVNINKKELINLHINKKLNTYEIADIYKCCQATIWKRLIEFNIKSRNPQELNSKIPTKKELKYLYIKKGLSTWKIGKKYGYVRSTIYRKLKEYNIKIRTLAEANTRYKKYDFSGNLIEKAYLIGFRLGDLRVRKIWEKSEVIHVDCGSSIKEQIDLIQNLFKPYGHVWLSKPNKKGHVQVECYLNLSFNFLLGKNIPKELLENKENFYAFLAGFTDAEGTIGVNNNQAYYCVVNQTKEYLYYIREKLTGLGINCPKLNLGSEKGTPRIDGDKIYYSNEDCWTLRLSKKSELYKFLLSIEPYIKHPKKVKNLKLAKNNILERNKKFGE